MATPSLFIRQKQRRTHGNTATSKANRKIEETLVENLSKITNTIFREVSRYNDEQAQQTQQQDKRTIIDTRIKPLMGSFVSATFRKHITESYLLGINYVSGAHSRLKKVPSYITSSDVERIKQLSESYSNRFWDRVIYRLEKEGEDNDIDIQSIISPLAIGATNETLNQATVTKVRKFTGRFSIGDSEFLSKEAATRKFDFNEIADELLDLGDLDLPLDMKVTMEWVTQQDDKVCEICEDLEGQYESDEDIPQPVESSHPNCRCRLVVAEDFDFEELAQEFLDLG